MSNELEYLLSNLRVFFEIFIVILPALIFFYYMYYPCSKKKLNELKVRYSNRSGNSETISQRYIYSNYEDALYKYLCGKSPFVAVEIFSKHERKNTIALITAMIQLEFLIIILLRHLNYKFELFGTLPCLMADFVNRKPVLLCELIILFIFSLIKFFLGYFQNLWQRSMLSLDLQMLSKYRPNFLLNGSVIDISKLSNESIELYISAFTVRRGCLQQETSTNNSFDIGVTLAVLITVIINTINDLEPIVFIIATIVSALILYFFKGTAPNESRDKMIELVICDIILQDLYDAKIKQLADNHLVNDDAGWLDTRYDRAD